ncbi:MAG: hypothetical protein ORN24_02405 [Burkholderiales bacterium]|nr:hypothetical protein [Burkholderiales bacterium]
MPNPQDLINKYPRTNEDFRKIIDLVQHGGFIYALCRIIKKDVHEFDGNSYKVLNSNELYFLIGMWLKYGNTDICNFDDLPKCDNLISLIYEYMHNLHFSICNHEYYAKDIHNTSNGNTSFNDITKAFLGGSVSITEQSFYSGDGGYGYQYIDLTQQLYSNDQDWLARLGLHVNQISLNFEHICKIISTKIHNTPPFLTANTAKQMYTQILNSNGFNKKEEGVKLIEQLAQNYFTTIKPYYDHFNMFVISNSELINLPDVRIFLELFAKPISYYQQSEFKNITDINQFMIYPVIKLDDERYFIPLIQLLMKVCYFSPRYWMLQDKNYSSQHGTTIESIVQQKLNKIFVGGTTYKSIKISASKNATISDIDVLCCYADIAVCVQIKSKRMTHQARWGDNNYIEEDFKKSVQKAYQQAILCKTHLLANSQTVKFCNDEDQPITIPLVKEVYILIVVNDDYPALNNQLKAFLQKQTGESYPIALTIFDLDIITTYYAKSPIKFLYYLYQRSKYMEEKIFSSEKNAFAQHYIKNTIYYSCIDPFDGNSFLLEQNYINSKTGILEQDELIKLVDKHQPPLFKKLCAEYEQLPNIEYQTIKILWLLYGINLAKRCGFVNLLNKIKQTNSVNSNPQKLFIKVPDSELLIIIYCFSSNIDKQLFQWVQNDYLQHKIPEYKAYLILFSSRNSKSIQCCSMLDIEDGYDFR